MGLGIIMSPLLGAIGAGLFGRYIGHKGAAIVTISGLATCWLMAVLSCYKVIAFGEVNIYNFFMWFDSGSMMVHWSFLFDSLTVLMCFVVSTISLLVHIFSVGYMSEDPHYSRFMSYLSLFTVFMLLLITANNFLQLFLGWEGVGLCSYLLINFWYTRIQANKAAIQAIIVNRFGDFGLGMCLILVYYFYQSLDFGTVFAMVSEPIDSFYFYGIEFNPLSLIGIMLFIGAVGKSAQLGLHTWLPTAMEGPTPVSALIHAATMVTAGVFALIRCSPILERSGSVLFVITIVGAMTAFFAATTGVLQNDLKRVVAYSTCSQLGYMIFTCGLSAYDLSFFHLVNHAFFKALLFLSAGVIIHALADEQDMRRMGGLVAVLPVTYTMVLLGSLSLMGFPFLTGFYSKDVILEVAASSYTVEGFFSYWLGLVSAFFTAFYSFRLIYLTFYAKPVGYRNVYSGAHDAGSYMLFSLVALYFGTIFFGYMFKDLFIGLGTDVWGNSIYIRADGVGLLSAEFLPASIKNLPFVFSMIGAGLSYLLNKYFVSTLVYIKMETVIGREIFSFLTKRWYFDLVYNHYVAQQVLKFGYQVGFKAIDRGLLEVVGPTGISRIVNKMTGYSVRLQSGYLYHYVFLFIFGIVGYLLSILLIFYFGVYIDYRLFILLMFALFFVDSVFSEDK